MQDIAGAQGAPLESAERPARIGGRAAEHARHADAALHSHIAARAPRDHADLHNVAALEMHTAPGADAAMMCVLHAYSRRAADKSEMRALGNYLERRPADQDFERRSIRPVAEK